MESAARGRSGPFHREAVRHLIAMGVAGVLASVLIVVATATTGPFDLRTQTGLSLTLVFGAYGPIFLVLSRVAFGSLRGASLRERLARSEERNTLVRTLFLGGPRSWAVMTVVIGLIGVLILATDDARRSPWLVAGSIACVVGTWVLLVAVFTVEYMRAWANDGSLHFPGDSDKVGFADFFYLSVQLSTTFSSSDVDLVKTSVHPIKYKFIYK